MSLLDWSDPHKTPRGSSFAQQAASDSPPRGREGVGLSPASSRPLSFAAVTGEIVWQTYPGHLWLTLEHAEAIATLIAEEWTRTRMNGGGPCEAVGMLLELHAAMRAAKDWQRAATWRPNNHNMIGA